MPQGAKNAHYKSFFHLGKKHTIQNFTIQKGQCYFTSSDLIASYAPTLYTPLESIVNLIWLRSQGGCKFSSFCFGRIFPTHYNVLTPIGWCQLQQTLKKLLRINNYFCIPESFNTNISHQLFDYTITLEHDNTNSKGDFVCTQ